MKKKVLHIISSTSWRGGEQQVNYMINHVSAEFDYYLFCPKDAELVNRNPDKQDNIFTYKKRFGFDIFAALELKKVCAKNSIDLIHLHDSHAINTYILADVLGMNIPAVIHRHVNFRISSPWKYSHKKIEKIVCVSKEVEKSLAAFTDEKKLVVIHPGIDVKRFASPHTNYLKQELNAANETKLIGIVSALEREKNIGEFIDIANKLSEKRKDVTFVIAGDGSLYKQFNSQLSTSNVHLLGFRNDIPEILSSLDVFLFTSKNEGFPLALLEAMAAGVPVISSDFASATEIIQQNKTGFIYNSTQDAVDKIEVLISQQETGNAIVENAVEFVQQFDLSLMNQKIETIYKELVNSK